MTTNRRVKCANCPWSGPEDRVGRTLFQIHHLAERLEPGGEVPAGECPLCGALAYLEPARSGCIWEDCDQEAVYCPGHAVEYASGLPPPRADLEPRARPPELFDGQCSDEELEERMSQRDDALAAQSASLEKRLQDEQDEAQYQHDAALDGRAPWDRRKHDAPR